jgi:hypothetical protein
MFLLFPGHGFVSFLLGVAIGPQVVCAIKAIRPSRMDISGKTAIVTGAASGIGLGIATALAEVGANLVMADIHRVCPSPFPRRAESSSAE